MNIKGEIKLDTVTDEVAFKWVRESLNTVLDKQQEKTLRALIDRLEANYSKYKRDSHKWDLIKPNLTKKQTSDLLEAL